ncbi:hypothetical protein PDE_02699 [Penicillium oxalicum 114-2]|uniref:Uncharacterized protein n=1 Tax=Penicillium oxalicum (strain 114-2 / CGMCC 5302) TaxID=933388 RepID=S7ZAX2_PENO1|nr:hypothetical protein PDE_02699 [Penicillium oxalicum 114-2]
MGCMRAGKACIVPNSGTAALVSRSSPPPFLSLDDHFCPPFPLFLLVSVHVRVYPTTCRVIPGSVFCAFCFNSEVSVWISDGVVLGESEWEKSSENNWRSMTISFLSKHLIS